MTQRRGLSLKKIYSKAKFCLILMKKTKYQQEELNMVLSSYLIIITECKNYKT
jgi:hypothetical protein